MLLQWRKEIAKFPDLPDLQDLVEDYAGEILLEDEYFEDEQGMSGVETGVEDEQSMPEVETGSEEGTLPEHDGQVEGFADGLGNPPPSPEKHTLSSSPATKPPEKKRRKVQDRELMEIA